MQTLPEALTDLLLNAEALGNTDTELQQALLLRTRLAMERAQATNPGAVHLTVAELAAHLAATVDVTPVLPGNTPVETNADSLRTVQEATKKLAKAAELLREATQAVVSLAVKAAVL